MSNEPPRAIAPRGVPHEGLVARRELDPSGRPSPRVPINVIFSTGGPGTPEVGGSGRAKGSVSKSLMGQMLKAAGQRQHWQEAIVLFESMQAEVRKEGARIVGSCLTLGIPRVAAPLHLTPTYTARSRLPPHRGFRHVSAKGTPPVKAAYEAALKACAKGAEWSRGLELLNEYIEVTRCLLCFDPVQCAFIHEESAHGTLGFSWWEMCLHVCQGCEELDLGSKLRSLRCKSFSAFGSTNEKVDTALVKSSESS